MTDREHTPSGAEGEGTHSPRAVAERHLRRVGLSAYAARTYIALLALGSGTATDVSDAAEVPRTRVYDAAAELQEWGLVDRKQASPTEFHPVSAETATRRVQRELNDLTAELSTALSALEPARRRERASGVWTVRGREAVTDRVVEFVSAAESEIVFASVASLVTDEILAALRAAADRGVAVRFAGLSPAVERRVTEAVPSAEAFESLWTGADTPAGRLLAVDGQRTLVSVLPEGERTDAGGGTDDDGGDIDNDRGGADDDGSDGSVPLASTVGATPEETAIWGSGDDNSLVVVLRAVFTWRLGDGDSPERGSTEGDSAERGPPESGPGQSE